jgi:F0F1-type ATP synthase assembly protein I
MEEPKNKNSQLNEYLKYSALGFQFFATIGLGVWLGWKLDEWLGLRFPAFTVALSCLGLIGSLIAVIRSLPKQ